MLRLYLLQRIIFQIKLRNCSNEHFWQKQTLCYEQTAIFDQYLTISQQVFTTADRPARRSASCPP